MRSKKILVLLPDGVGLRNFAFTSFVEKDHEMGFEVIFWNSTPFNLATQGFKEFNLTGKPRALTDLLKRAKINAELESFKERFKDKTYDTYKFPSSNKSVKSIIKNLIVFQLTKIHKGENGLKRLRRKIKESERNSSYYKNCKALLLREKPDFVFCTNQRPVTAIAPLTAAQDLGISTGTFIFSWDNLPKATMVVEPDFYFVWSEYMKHEMQQYYPYIKERQILITGTPQFEPHFNPEIRQTKEEFFSEHFLNPKKEYICFSGDDITTSPDDPEYLKDVAEAVENLNTLGFNLGIIFRRCPVDFSDRYDKVLNDYKDLIVPIAPKWDQIGSNWNSVIPSKEDHLLHINTIRHSKAVVNLGSSMVFDFAIFNKPCLFLNYDVENKENETWSTKKIYQFIHFRSMPTGEEVLWINSKKDILPQIRLAITENYSFVEKANLWFQKINKSPAEKASQRIWDEIESILEG